MVCSDPGDLQQWPSSECRSPPITIPQLAYNLTARAEMYEAGIFNPIRQDPIVQCRNVSVSMLPSYRRRSAPDICTL